MRFSLLFILLLFSVQSYAQNAKLITDLNLLQPAPSEIWQTVTSDHFAIHYQPQDQPFAQKLALIAEKVHQELTLLLKWTPQEKTHIVVNDSVDMANGAATPLPYNQFFIYMTPPIEGELQDQTGWIEQVFTHEYTHVLHFDQVSGSPETLRQIFGRTNGLLTFFTFPELFAPHWSSEGIAIYTESAKGHGRNHHGIYESKMRQEVIRGLRSFSEESYEGYYNSRWPFGQVYLYGAYFYQFVEATYGRDKLLDYITHYNDNLIPWRMNSRAQRTFGLDNETLWQHFQSYLTQRFTPQIEAIQAKGLTPQKTIVNEPFYNHLLTTGPKDSLIYYHDDRLSQPEIRQVTADGRQTTLLAMTEVQALDWHNDRGLLISRNEVCQNKNVYSDLYLYTPQDQKLTRLTECARLPRMKWNRDGSQIFAVHLEQGRTDLVRLESDGSLLRFAKMPLDSPIGHFDIAPDDSQIIASVKRPNSGWNLEALDLIQLTWQPLTRGTHKASRPRFSQDGQQVYYLSDNQQQVELQSLNLANGKTTTWTNSLGYVVDYALLPTEQAQTGFWLSEYQATNEQLSLVNQPTPLTLLPSSISSQADPTKPDSPAPVNLSTPVPYSPMATLTPVGWSPILGIGNEMSVIGAQVNGQDILGFHRYLLAPMVYKHPEGTDLGGFYQYSYHNRFNVLFSREINQASVFNFLDWVDSQTLQAYYHRPINHIDWSADLMVGASLEKNQYRITGFNAQSQILGIQAAYNSVAAYPHGIGVTDGWIANIGLETYVGGDYQGQVLKTQAGHYFDLGKGQILKLDGFLGLGSEESQPFQLGGSSATFPSLLPQAQIGLRDVALRGYASNPALRDTRIQRWTTQYSLPLASLYDGFYNLPTGIGRISASVFADTGATSENHYYTGIGAELHAEWLIGYDSINLPLTLGYAKGLDQRLGDQQVYLQLGFGF